MYDTVGVEGRSGTIDKHLGVCAHVGKPHTAACTLRTLSPLHDDHKSTGYPGNQ